MTRPAEKKILRSQLRQQRRNLGHVLRQHLSVRIVTHLRTWLSTYALDESRGVALFAAHAYEPNIDALVDVCSRRRWSCAWPSVEGDGAGARLCFRQTPDVHGLDLGRFGLRTPSNNSPIITPEEIGLWLVPCLGFDQAGGRLGSGLGLYDRILASTGAPVVGVAFACQKMASPIAEAHDIPLNFVATEDGVFSF